MLSEIASLIEKSVLSSIGEVYSVAYPYTLPGALVVHIASKHIPPYCLPENPPSYIEVCYKLGIKRLLLPFPSSFIPDYTLSKEFSKKSFLKGIEIKSPLRSKELDALMADFDKEERLEVLSEVCQFLGAKYITSLPLLPSAKP